MTPTQHPTDEQLLLHAEGEREPAVEEHVAACEACREAVASSLRGADVLRAAELLRFPTERREETLAALPARERARRPGRRFLGVAVPLVALASVVAVVGLTGGTTDPERSAEQMAAQDAARAGEDAADEAPSAALEAAPAEEEDAPAVRAVAGPAEEVARELRAAGFDAEAVDGAVELRDADPAAVEEALRDRPDGEVELRFR